MQFEWDKKKAISNLQKHGVTFEEARQVFESLLSADFLDSHHSHVEERWLKIGPTASGKIIIISYTERRNKVRIISVRHATKQEIKSYEKRKPKD